MPRKNYRVVLTAFDAFGGESLNAAEEALRKLPGSIRTAGGSEIHIEKAILPTSFARSAALLERLLSEQENVPDAVLCLGQAAGRNSISLERIAINLDDARIPDNDGDQPEERPIKEGGPAAYFAKLPLKKLLQALRSEGIPAILSNTAGTYVCNHLMYTLLHLLNSRAELAGTSGGFIHLPLLPEQCCGNRPAPSMPAELTAHALEIILCSLAEEASN